MKKKGKPAWALKHRKTKKIETCKVEATADLSAYGIK
jgi:hypothetical protein